MRTLGADCFSGSNYASKRDIFQHERYIGYLGHGGGGEVMKFAVGVHSPLIFVVRGNAAVNAITTTVHATDKLSTVYSSSTYQLHVTSLRHIQAPSHEKHESCLLFRYVRRPSIQATDTSETSLSCREETIGRIGPTKGCNSWSTFSLIWCMAQLNIAIYSWQL